MLWETQASFQCVICGPLLVSVNRRSQVERALFLLSGVSSLRSVASKQNPIDRPPPIAQRHAASVSACDCFYFSNQAWFSSFKGDLDRGRRIGFID